MRQVYIPPPSKRGVYRVIGSMALAAIAFVVLSISSLATIFSVWLLINI